MRLSRAVDQARAAAVPGYTARLSHSVTITQSRLGQSGKRDRAAAAIIGLAGKTSGDVAARATGVAQYIAGDCGAAVRAFQSLQRHTADDWNDLAAAQVCAAESERRADTWISALATVDRALREDPHHAEAQFNRALVLEALGAHGRAKTQWLKYLALDGESVWSALARKRLMPIPIADTDAWWALVPELGEVTAEHLQSVTKRYPEPARRFSEVLYLSMWAGKIKAGDHAGAQRYFEQIRVIAETLKRETGESLLADTVLHIETLSVRSPPVAVLDGLSAYYEGRKAYKEGEYVSSEARLTEAETLLARTGCPLAKMAEFYRASAIGEQHRTAEALEILRRRLASERAAGAPHKALLAHTQYQLALYEAAQGHWSVSLAAASESLALYLALRERENAVAPYAVISEDYDLIGQRELSLTHGVAGVRAAFAAGDYDRARATLATLCRTELRAGEAERALSISSLEWEIAHLAPEPRHGADMFLRRASAQWHLGKFGDATHSLNLARKEAVGAPDPATRIKLAADIDAAEGTFARRRDPHRAITLLSSAIEFQDNAARPIVLPELYLQRGRAFLAVNDLAAADLDFEAGLSELERQRTHVGDAELRPGIFDDASELFDEAIALAIQRGGDADAVLRQVERGRARAVLEQINAGDDPISAPSLPRIADVQRALDAETAVLEYVSLPDRLVVLAITRDRAVIRTIPITRAELIRTADAFTAREGMDGSTMYDILLAPLEPDLRGISAVNVIADDILQRVPFAAFFDRKTQTFAVERYMVASSPSAGVLLTTFARTQRLPPLQSGAILVLANPSIPLEEFGELVSLPGAAREAVTIARPYSRSRVFTGDAATAERFHTLAPEYEFVHFGGHGVIKEREPFSSALVCAASPRRAGGLSAREIARMKFTSTRAVVLAACSTMTGRNAAVEGVPTLARAFVVAGVPAVVGTLWDIEDGEASAITLPLHEALAHGVAPAVALRSAQIAAIRRGLPPSQWSAFALMGSAAGAAPPSVDD